MPIVAVTGHRPPRLDPEAAAWLPDELARVFTRYAATDNPVSELWVGMARGTDMIAATVGIEQGIPTVAVLPFLSWRSRWPKKDQTAADPILTAVRARILVCTDDPPAHPHACYATRNRMLIEAAETLIAVWDGEHHGGTFATVQMARARHRQIIHINPVTRATTITHPARVERDDHGS